MFAEEFSKYVGYTVYNEFNEVAGVIIGYICDGIGEVKSVIIRAATDVYDIPFERIELKQDSVKVISSITYEFKNIERKIRNVYGRFAALEKIGKEEVNIETLNEIKNKVDESYKQISEQIEKFRSLVENKLASISNMIKNINSSLIELKLQYVNGQVSKERYQEILNRLKEAEERLKSEFAYYNNYIKAIENLTNNAVVEVVVQ